MFFRVLFSVSIWCSQSTVLAARQTLLWAQNDFYRRRALKPKSSSSRKKSACVTKLRLLKFIHHTKVTNDAANKKHINPGVRVQLSCVAYTLGRANGAIATLLRPAGPSGQRPTKSCSIARVTELYSSRRYGFCKPLSCA